MGRRLSPPTSLIPRPSGAMVCVFRTPWGWMGVSETSKGIDAIVLPKSSRQAVLSELGLLSAKFLERPISPRLREAQVQLIGYLAGTRQSFDLETILCGGTP